MTTYGPSAFRKAQEARASEGTGAKQTATRTLSRAIAKAKVVVKLKRWGPNEMAIIPAELWREITGALTVIEGRA